MFVIKCFKKIYVFDFFFLKDIIANLVRVTVQIEVLQESGGKLAEERVVGFIYGPETPVGVVIGAGAGTETSHCTNKRKQIEPTAIAYLKITR